MGLRASEVLEEVAVDLGGNDPQVDLESGVRHAMDARRSGPAGLLDQMMLASALASASGSVAVAIRSTSLQVSVRAWRRPAISTASQAG